MSMFRTFSLVASSALLVWGVGQAPALVSIGSSATAKASTTTVAEKTAAIGSDDELQARAKLAQLARTYRHLEGVTIEFGLTPNGEQAVSYFERGRIVIDPEHEAGVNSILEHEIWHIIDWRDNGRLDWGEQVPPDGSERYLR